MRKQVVFLAAFLFIFALSACTSSRGEAFENTSGSISAQQSADDEDKETLNRQLPAPGRDRGVFSLIDTDPDQNRNAALIINSTPPSAAVYINGRYAGTTPFYFQSLDTDRYHIELRSSGYYSQSAVIDYSGKGQHNLYFTLKEITGFLSVTGGIPARVKIGRLDYQSPLSMLELPVGRHIVRVEAFGYTTELREIFIKENTETLVEAELQKAQFTAEDFAFARQKINPAGIPAFSTLTFSYTVSGPGEGTASVVSVDGNTLLSFPLGPFSDFPQKQSVSGHDIKAAGLTDGEYALVLEMEGEDGNTAVLSSYFTVDSSLYFFPRSCLQGNSGQLYTADAYTLPAAVSQFSSFVAGHKEKTDGRNTLLLPVHWSYRYGLSDSSEIALSGTIVVTNDTELSMPFSVATGFKNRFAPFSGYIENAAFVTLIFGDNTQSDMFAAFPGLHTGLPVSFHLRESGIPVSLTITPEFAFSWRYPSYESVTPDPGVHAWSYVKSSLAFDNAVVSTALSFSIRTGLFSDGLAFPDQPFAGGFELHFIPPSTSLVFSLYTFGEADTSGGYYLNGGLGMGLFF